MVIENQSLRTWNTKKVATSLFVTVVILFSFLIPVNAEGPLKVHPKNWRYFIDGSGKTVVFAGSHSWGRKEEDKHWVSHSWDINKFNKYLDFLEYWNHNYIRLWMWEHQGDVDVWMKNENGKYDLLRLNPEYFDRVRSFVEAASSRGIYCGVMLFQGWSGCNSGSKPDWPGHPMNNANNINGIDGDPDGIGYGIKVHSLDNPEIVKFQKKYIDKMVETLNGYDNIIWEVGNEISHSGREWINYVIDYIREQEQQYPKQHLVLDGLCYGGNNDAEWTTHADTYCPGALIKWSGHDEIYVVNPPEPDVRLKNPVILDSDHIGNIFSGFTAYEQRSSTWKSFTRGNHVIHMDGYDTGWDSQVPVPNHPVQGVSTDPRFDPKRKSMGDIIYYAEKVNIVDMIPVTDRAFCSTSFCLVGEGQYIVYQPDTVGAVDLNLEKGKYHVETFDTTDSSAADRQIRWKGGKITLNKPEHVANDWVLLIKNERR